MRFRRLVILASLLALAACGSGSSGTPSPDSGSPDAGLPDGGGPTMLSVTLAGSGSGTVSSSPSGIDCGFTCSAGFDAGASVTLTATAAAHSSFGGWSGDCSGLSDTCALTLDQGRSAGAIFTLDPVTLTVTLSGDARGTVVSNPAGLTCTGSSCQGDFGYGTTVILVALPDVAGFGGWSGPCSGTGSCAVALNQATSVDAAFVPIPPAIDIASFSFSPSELTVDAGTVVAINNSDSAPHTVTSETSDDAFNPGSVNGVSFNTGNIGPHSSSSITIPAGATSGTVIPFYCVYHQNMMNPGNGHITVR